MQPAAETRLDAYRNFEQLGADDRDTTRGDSGPSTLAHRRQFGRVKPNQSKSGPLSAWKPALFRAILR